MIEDVHTTAASLPPTIRELRATFAELRETAAVLTRTAGELEAAKPGEAVNATVAEVQASARALTAVTGRMEGSLDRLDAILAKVDGGRGTLGMLVNDSSLYLQFHETLREVGALVADIRERPGRYINLKVF
jgi:phospholipid/cholesterol/gamma-HCH transport system substrate-binding protein